MSLIIRNCFDCYSTSPFTIWTLQRNFEMATVLQWKSLHVLRLFHKRPRIQVKALLCKEKKHIQGKSSNTSTFAGTLLRRVEGKWKTVAKFWRTQLLLVIVWFVFFPGKFLLISARKCQATLFVLFTIKYDVADLQVSVLETGCKRLLLWHDCVVCSSIVFGFKVRAI